MSIYVETLIRAPFDALWAHTQTPALHQAWDLRFTEIEYLPRASASDPQRFRYSTRIGFGHTITGKGETVGQRTLDNGGGTSALRFAADQGLSLIDEGSGYWKYVPTADGVRFITWYDYRTRYGALGAVWDRWVFRPFMGWATAWSFDRLRLWLERSIGPAQALRHMLVHVVSRCTLAMVFFYHGLVPKLLTVDAGEIEMLRASRVPAELIPAALTAIGVAELVFGAALLVAWRHRWPDWLCLIAMVLASISVGLSAPHFFTAAFNPFSLNIAVAALAAIDLLIIDTVPSAARCRRQASPEEHV